MNRSLVSNRELQSIQDTIHNVFYLLCLWPRTEDKQVQHVTCWDPLRNHLSRDSSRWRSLPTTRRTVWPGEGDLRLRIGRVGGGSTEWVVCRLDRGVERCPGLKCSSDHRRPTEFGFSGKSQVEGTKNRCNLCRLVSDFPSKSFSCVPNFTHRPCI